MRVKLEEVCKRIYAGGDVPKDRYSEMKTDKYSVPIYANAEKNDGLYGYTDKAREKELSITVAARGTIGFTVIRREPFLPVIRLITVVPDTKKVSERYLYYVLKNCKPQFSGTSIPQLTVPDIKKNSLELYNTSEQIKIADRLDKISKIIELRKQELSALDNLIKARFVEMFGTGNYPIEKLGAVCKKITDGTHKTPTYLNEGITFISAKNIVNGELDFTDIKYISEIEYQEIQKRCQTAIYDILLSKSGSLGSPVIVKTEKKLGLFESLAILKYDRKKLVPEFLCEQLKTDRIQRQFTTGTKGVAIKHLHLGVIADTDIIVPALDEQKEFADFVHQVNKSGIYQRNKIIYVCPQ